MLLFHGLKDILSPQGPSDHNGQFGKNEAMYKMIVQGREGAYLQRETSSFGR